MGRLAELDYAPLSDKPDKATMDAYRAEHEVLDKQRPPEIAGLVFGHVDDWLRRWRFDTFAHRNGLTYDPRVEPAPYQGTEFRDHAIIDVLTGADGAVTVGTATSIDVTVHDRWKFVAVDLGVAAPTLKLVPHKDKHAETELARQFAFEGASYDPKAARRKLAKKEAPHGLRQTLRTIFGPDAYDDAKRQASSELASALFDEATGRVIVGQAAGFTIELSRGPMVVHRSIYSDEDTLKPQLIEQMFTIAVVLGPVIARAVGGMPRFPAKPGM